MKKLVPILLAIALVFSIAACGEGGSGNQPSTTPNTPSDTPSSNPGSTAEDNTNDYVPTSSLDSIRVGRVSVPPTLQPFIAVGQVPVEFTESIYEYLFVFTKENDGGLETQIAKGYTASEDGLVYDVEIYDYVTDSKGNHITADDVVFCYETYAATGMCMGLAKMASIEKTGDYSVRFTLTDNAMGSWEGVARGTPIVSQKEYEASPDGFSSEPVGTGAYVVSDFQPNTSFTIQKRQDYWQKDELRAWYSSANVNEITYISIPEGSQMAIALETGTVDMVSQIPQSSGEQFLNSDEFMFYPVTTRLGLQIYFSGDAHSPVADNAKLRQAILYAIDNDAIITVAYGGFGEKQYTFGPDTCPDFQQQWKDEDYFNYNPEKAKELLEEAGYKPGDLHLQILTVNMDVWSKTCQVIQQNLDAIGIDLEILNHESALYGSELNDGANYDIVLNNTTSDYLVGLWNNKLGAQNYNGVTCSSIDDPHLQELLQGCLYQSNHTPENVLAFHEYLKEQAYCCGLCAQQAFNFTTKEVGIVEPYFDGLCTLYLPCCTFA